MRKLFISISLHYTKCMIRQVAHLTPYVTQRDRELALLANDDLRALYVEIDTKVEKALGLIFRRSTTMYTRHIWLHTR
jgi:hypothetical protein